MAEVVTGEAVVLDLTVARFPSRILALLIDVLVQVPVLFFVDIVVSLSSQNHLNGASAAAVYLAGTILVVVGYPVIFETLSRGKTLGKLALGIRVVCDDGSPVRFRQSLIRALSLAFIELWIPPFTLIGLPTGLITSMVSAKGKRLGDLFAGTFVISERLPRRPDLAPIFTIVPPQLAGWAAHLELARLSDATAAAASSYLRRFNELRSPAREQLGIALATAVAEQVSPPPPLGTDAAAFLAAVLATRRQRELARLQARQAAAWQLGAPPAGAVPRAGAFPAAAPGVPRPGAPLPGGPLAAAPSAAASPRAVAVGVTPQGTIIGSPDDSRPEPAASSGSDSPGASVTVSQTEPLNDTPPDDLGFAAPF